MDIKGSEELPYSAPLFEAVYGLLEIIKDGD